MSDLFSPDTTPLAHKIRPNLLDEVIGQKKAIFELQQIKKPMSLLLYGPPGTGKSTICKILSKRWGLPFVEWNAVSTGVAEIKKLLQKAKESGTILLFLDEIHRFSSSQQDSLLEGVETGKLILLAATTEHPGFRITKPLLSRLKLIKLESLSEESLSEILNRALLETNSSAKVSAEAKSLLIRFSGGDARKLLSYLEELILQTADGETATEEEAYRILENRVVDYDKSGESHYDVISAFIKSIRGSDPDAALFYLALMLEGGEDPLFIMRRLVILASEDIGNASVHALPLANAGMQSIEKIGMPEGRILLANVTTFLASCPKSNASYLALDEAISYVRSHGTKFSVPMRIRNAPTSLHKKEGAHKGYEYPHDFPSGFVKFRYFPDDLYPKPPVFYMPKEIGMEKNITERLRQLWPDRYKSESK